MARSMLIGGQTSENSDLTKPASLTRFTSTIRRQIAGRSRRRCRRGAAAGLRLSSTARFMWSVAGRREAPTSLCTIRKPTAGPRCPTCRRSEIIWQRMPSTARFMSSAGDSKAAFAASEPISLKSSIRKLTNGRKRRSMLRPRGGVNGIAANGCFHLFGGEGNPEHPYGIYPDHDYYNPVRIAGIGWRTCRFPCTA